MYVEILLGTNTIFWVIVIQIPKITSVPMPCKTDCFLPTGREVDIDLMLAALTEGNG